MLVSKSKYQLHQQANDSAAFCDVIISMLNSKIAVAGSRQIAFEK